MKNKKQIFSTTLTIVVSIFLVSIGVYAATTIGTNIDTAGTLDVTGASTFSTASTSGNFWLGNVTADDDDYLYMDASSSEYMMWDNDPGQFDFSDDLKINGYATTTAGLFTQGNLWVGGNSTTTDMYFGGRVDMGSQGSGIAVTTENPFGFDLHVKPVTDITPGSTGRTAGIRMRYETGEDQTTQISMAAILGHLRIKKDLADGVHAGVEGYIEADGGSATVIGGAATTQTSAGHFSIELGTGVVVSTGWLSGISVNSSVNASATITGTEFTGVRINKATSAKDWEYGIHLRDATKAIDADADAGAIAGAEVHGISLTFTGEASETADQIVGINSVVTPTGTLSGWTAGIFGNVTQGATKTNSGYITGGEFEVINACSTASGIFPITLDAGGSVAYDAQSSFIFLNDWGTSKLGSLLRFGDASAPYTISDTAIFTTHAVAQPITTHAIRFVGPDNTPYWIMVTTDTPAS